MSRSIVRVCALAIALVLGLLAPLALGGAAQARVADPAVTIEVLTTQVQVNKSGKAKVKIACPAALLTGPCTGQVKLKTRQKFQFGGRNNLVLLAAQRYAGLPAGQALRVSLTIGDAQLALLEKKPKARKIHIQVSVKDADGHRSVVSPRAKIVLP